ncbi:MAG: hypothetical protein QOF56_518 [Acidobacteriaceae bacterium]|nr:hypothetical protein [Acidobacteriaceae bacterium]
MPLFTVTMRSSRVSRSERPPFQSYPRRKHCCWISRGRPFQRFLSLEPSDLRVDLYYPALPKPRSDQMVMVEVLVS